MPRKVFTEAEQDRAILSYPWNPDRSWITSVRMDAERLNSSVVPEELIVYIYHELIVSVTCGVGWPHSISGRIKQLMDEEAGPPPFETGDDVE